jgi:hypothetical protein
MKRVAVLAAALLLGAGCDKDKDAGGTSPATSAPGAAASGPTKPAANMTDAELDKADIPVPADFEEEAEREINDDNLDAEIDKLEKEIGAE